MGLASHFHGNRVDPVFTIRYCHLIKNDLPYVQAKNDIYRSTHTLENQLDPDFVDPDKTFVNMGPEFSTYRLW